MTHDSWSLGWLIGGPVLILATILSVICILAIFVLSDDGRFIAAIVAFVVVGLTIMGHVSFYPYGPSWHRWYKVSGQVEQVSSRMIKDGEGMAQRYVVVLRGEPYGVDDTRASLLKVGDTVTLKCKREWQYTAQAGWGCRWGGRS